MDFFGISSYYWIVPHQFIKMNGITEARWCLNFGAINCHSYLTTTSGSTTEKIVSSSFCNIKLMRNQWFYFIWPMFMVRNNIRGVWCYNGIRRLICCCLNINFTAKGNNSIFIFTAEHNYLCDRQYWTGTYIIMLCDID